MSNTVIKYKYTFLVILFIIAALGYMDRYAINYAIISITKDLKINASETGLILSSFYIGYALMQVPGGWLSDRLGTNRVLYIVVSIWSLFTFLSGMVGTLSTMIAVRFLFGIAEGPFFPTSMKAISETFPQQERSRAFSTMTSSGAIVGLFSPLLITWMMTKYGWRSQFFVTGLAGFVVLFLYMMFRKSFKSLIHQQSNIETGKKIEKAPYRTLLKSPLLWKIVVGYYAVYTIATGEGVWLPTYQVKVFKITLMAMGALAMFPAFASIIGFYISGYIIDKVTPKRSKQLAVLCSIFQAIFLYLMYTASTVPVFYTFYTLQSLLLPFLIVFLATTILRSFPSEVAGFATGVGNLGSTVTGFTTPVLMGIMVDAFKGSFVGAFGLMILFGFISAIIFLTFRKDKRTIIVNETNDIQEVPV